MRNILRCRRGSVAFATVIALVPLIGVVALGAEAGSWYVTKQHAQNAADAAAYSGGLRLACSISGSSTCDTAHDYVYRGKQFADQNKFCNPNDTSYPCANAPPTGTTRTVQIDQPTSSRVRAIVSQQQPAYLAAVLGLSTVNIGAEAIAEVQNPKQVCALGLGPSNNALTIGGSSNITGNTGCGLMSDTAVKYNSTPTFSGSGWAVNAVNGCVASAGHCALSVPYNYNMLPATNPLQALDTASFNSWTSTGKPNKPACSGTLQPNNSTNLYGDLTCNNGNSVTFSTGGTFFFYNATIRINSGAIVNGTNVNIVLLGNSSLTINGGTINLSANMNNGTYPGLSGVLIDDQATGAVTINGSTVSLGGAMYFPKADVTWGGNVQSLATTCTEVIAKTLTINGNSYLSTDNCAPGTISKTQVVALVQ